MLRTWLFADCQEQAQQVGEGPLHEGDSEYSFTPSLANPRPSTFLYFLHSNVELSLFTSREMHSFFAANEEEVSY
ncbi:hypothetical protein E2C01_000442 [Portunus trituberculatus]|uniref:Uncharacterized protein n=1 Tax=Portunus trituberculatus TaxID=210409 RepID=A0A5B7CGL2_PORTR|nr:hypothetical protein [Portunus trituberculatus]